MHVCCPHCGERCRVLRPRYFSSIYLYSFILSHSLILYYIYYFLLRLSVRRAPTRAFLGQGPHPLRLPLILRPLMPLFAMGIWEKHREIPIFPFPFFPYKRPSKPTNHSRWWLMSPSPSMRSCQNNIAPTGASSSRLYLKTRRRRSFTSPPPSSVATTCVLRSPKHPRLPPSPPRASRGVREWCGRCGVLCCPEPLPTWARQSSP